jgi:hypothetical protein
MLALGLEGGMKEFEDFLLDWAELLLIVAGAIGFWMFAAWTLGG